MNFKLETAILLGFNFIILSLLFIVSKNMINYAQINADGSYYLSYTENVFKGYRPYTDMGLDYMPLVIYIFLFFKTIYNAIEYEHFLLLQILSYFFSAFLIYKILLLLNQSKIRAASAGILFIGSIFTYDGIYIILEPYLIVFSLSTIYLMLKAQENSNNLLFYLAGFLSICCFFCKQYGLLIYPPVAAYFLWSYYKDFIKLKSIFSFILGIITAIISLFIFLFYCQNIDVPSFFNSIFKPTYVNDYANFSIDIVISFFKYSIFFVFPIILMLPLLLTSSISKQLGQVLLIIATGISFLIVMFVRQYPHYFQLALPFLILTIVILYDKSTSWKIKQIRLFPIGVFLMCLTMYNCVNRLFELNQFLINNKSIKVNQLANAALINSLVPPRTPATNLSETPSYSYLCDIIAPDFKVAGFNFYLKNETQNSQQNSELERRIKPNIINSTFVITDSRSEQSFPGTTQILTNYSFVPIKTSPTGLCIWKKSSLKNNFNEL